MAEMKYSKLQYLGQTIERHLEGKVQKAIRYSSHPNLPACLLTSAPTSPKTHGLRYAATTALTPALLCACTTRTVPSPPSSGCCIIQQI